MKPETHTVNDALNNQRPFLKWAGGKYKLANLIKTTIPSGKRLIEPFVGSGAIFLNTDYKRYTLNDINKDLINVFKYLKREKVDFIDYCRTFFTEKSNTKPVFLSNRDPFNTTEDKRLKAALFIYLNRHAFNGLIRYNQSGEFNTSFGSYIRPYFPYKEMLNFSKKVQSAKLMCQDFSDVMRQAVPGDVIYCDPPYVPLSGTSNFTSYYSTGFCLAKQQALVSLAKTLANKGIPVIISNHDTQV